MEITIKDLTRISIETLITSLEKMILTLKLTDKKFITISELEELKESLKKEAEFLV